MRSFDPGIAVAAERIEALLIGANPQDVGTFHGVFGVDDEDSIIREPFKRWQISQRIR
jgi:hypothetical protein